MEWPADLYIFSTIFFSLIILFLLRYQRRNSFHHRLPPGPSGWPIVGNMFDLGVMPHRTLASLRPKYGDVIWLKFGAINTMAILSTKAATEFFKHHDLTFAERTITEVMRANDYHQGSLALAPYGPYWRLLRKLVTVDMLVTKRINDTSSVRRKCVDDMLMWIQDEAQRKKKSSTEPSMLDPVNSYAQDGAGDGHEGVHVARFVFLMTFNLFGNLMLSRDIFDPKSEDGMKFFEAMRGLMEWSGHANSADFFPWLRWFDPQGLRRKMECDLGKAMDIASKFVNERLNHRETGEEKRSDFLDVLLEFKGNGKDEPEKISSRDLNIFILEIFLAGSETTSSSIEWGLTELLCNVESMTKVKAELGQVIGPNRRLEESDIDNLPYLQAVVKETLRLHPPIPFLVPRRAMKDTNFMGYDIPENTQVLVNAWAIGRDPDVWEDPLCFKPERFIGSTIDYRGQHFELIPFGAGRRMCAGVALGHRVLHLVLGSLLHHFDWALDGSVTKHTIDMKDRLGVTMRKYEPLFAVPKKS